MTLKWLDKLSQFIRENHQADLDYFTKNSRQKEPSESKKNIHPDARLRLYQKIVAERPLDSEGGKLPIDEIQGVWDLLRIAFSESVAASSAVTEHSMERELPASVRLGSTSEAAVDTLSIPSSVLNIVSVKLGKPADALTAVDCRKLQELKLEGASLSDLSWLAEFGGLDHLDLDSTGVSELVPLASLLGLRFLDIRNNPIKSLESLSGLTNLETLYAGGTQVRDLSPLSGLTSLRKLYLWNCKVRDLSPLSRLDFLHTLFLRGTQVRDVSPLSGLTSLSTLFLSSTYIDRAAAESLLPHVKIVWE